MLQFDSRHQQAKVMRLGDPFDASEVSNYQERSQLLTAQYTLASMKVKFCVFTADYYRSSNSRRRLETDEERETK